MYSFCVISGCTHMNRLEGRGEVQPGGRRSLDAAGWGLTTYFLIFSRMSAILPKRFCVKKQLRSRETTAGPRSPWSCPTAPRPRTG